MSGAGSGGDIGAGWWWGQEVVGNIGAGSVGAGSNGEYRGGKCWGREWWGI